LDCKHLCEWLCYQPIKGGCPKGGACGCSCSVPLYAYWWKECKEGRTYELPPCVAEKQNRPSVLHSLFQDGCSRLRSVGSGFSTCCVQEGRCRRTASLFGQSRANGAP